MTSGDPRPEARRPDRLTVELAEVSFTTEHRPERAAALARLLLGPVYREHQDEPPLKAVS